MTVAVPAAQRRGALPAIARWLVKMSGSSLENPANWFIEWATGGATYTGKAVNRTTAMQCSTVYGCVRILATSIAHLPIEVREQTPDGSVIVPDHPVQQLLEQPNQVVTDFQFKEMLVERLLLDGNARAAIFRRGDFRPVEMLTLDREHIARTEARGGRLIYHVRVPVGEGQFRHEVVDQDFMQHVAGPGFDGKESPSPIQWAAKQAIGLALGLEEHQARYVGSGGRPSGALEIPQGIGEETANRIKEDWTSQHGTLSQAGKTALLWGGSKYHPISFSSVDAEILASRRMQVAEIARVYGVPLHLLFETERSTSWGSGLEEQSASFVRYTLRPLARRIEAEWDRKLFRDEERARLSVRFNFDELLRGTARDRALFLESMVQKSAIMLPNEARRMEGLPPLPGGDELRQPTGAPTQEVINVRE